MRGFPVIHKPGRKKKIARGRGDRRDKSDTFLCLLAREDRRTDRQRPTLNNNGPRLCLVKERNYKERWRKRGRGTSVETRPKGCGRGTETQREIAPVMDGEARMTGQVVIEHARGRNNERSK